jgi:hypothetical protein
MDKQLSPLLLALALTASASASGPPPAEDAARLRQMAASHLFQQTAGLPGEVTINVELPKSTARLARCEAAEAFIPEGARLAGSLAVGIRCQAPSSWTTYVRASVSIVANYLVAAAPLRPGQVLTADVLERRRGDLGKLAQDVMTERKRPSGKSWSPDSSPARHCAPACCGPRKPSRRARASRSWSLARASPSRQKAVRSATLQTDRWFRSELLPDRSSAASPAAAAWWISQIEWRAVNKKGDRHED